MTNALPHIAVLAAASLTLAACGSSATTTSHASHTATTHASSSAPAGTAAPAAKASVLISNYAFHPVTVTVRPGARVTFSNHDQTAHTATSSSSGVFDSGTIAPGASRTVVLKHAGTYTYYCQFHAFMRATLVVK